MSLNSKLRMLTRIMNSVKTPNKLTKEKNFTEKTEGYVLK